MAESSFFNFYRAAETHKSDESNFWFFRLIRTLLALMFATILTDIGIVMFWPDGLNLLKQTYTEEIQYLSVNIDAKTTDTITRWANTAYEWVFVKTGFQGILYGARNDIARSLIDGFWPVFQGITIGFQIFIIRVCVIILMLPFLVLIMGVAASDGYLEWYLRRTGGGRESAFIYHRSKYLLSWSLIGLWFLYLVPPFAVDPVWIFIPSALFLALFTRLSIQFFKKYI